MADSAEVRLPKLGLQVGSAVVVRWLRTEGDRVKEGEDLLEVETEKINTTVPAPVTGMLRQILVHPEEEVPVGTVLGLIEPSPG